MLSQKSSRRHWGVEPSRERCDSFLSTSSFGLWCATLSQNNRSLRHFLGPRWDGRLCTSSWGRGEVFCASARRGGASLRSGPCCWLQHYLCLKWCSQRASWRSLQKMAHYLHPCSPSCLENCYWTSSSCHFLNSICVARMSLTGCRLGTNFLCFDHETLGLWGRCGCRRRGAAYRLH